MRRFTISKTLSLSCDRILQSRKMGKMGKTNPVTYWKSSKVEGELKSSGQPEEASRKQVKALTHNHLISPPQ